MLVSKIGGMTMLLSKKCTLILAAMLSISVVSLSFSACKAAIGTPWYQRSAGANEVSQFAITDIRVRQLPVTAVLTASPVDDSDKIRNFSEAKRYIVVLPPNVQEITAEDIVVTAFSDLTKKEALSVEVTLNGDSVPLIPGQTVPVTIKIADAAGDYMVQEKVISITRNEPYPLALESLTICGIPVTADSLTVPYTVGSISAKDVTAIFEYGGNKTALAVDLGIPVIKLYENEAVEVSLSVKGLAGQYQGFEKTVSITREIRPENADVVLEVDAIYILGYRYEAGKALGVPVDTEYITGDDVVASFKNFGDLPVKITPNPAVFRESSTLTLTLSVDAKEGKYQAWETSLTVKKDPTAVYNPQDKNGNRKYIVKVKTITEQKSPFDYYEPDYEFSASKFDNWVLVMPSMSGIITSYKFQDGSWSGSPDSIDNIPSSIGSGLKAISNVKIYRYKNRTERWSAHDKYVPAADPNESRFYFYRFTAVASGGVTPDSSLFCVDRYSKFLFYYSEPSNIEWMFGNAIPKDWVDYAIENKKDHVQFAEPFYMSDPVGYVKEDGSVVIYSWLKDNINNAQYHAQKNSAYTKPAVKNPGKPGYSPYRDKISTKRSEIETAVNPAYTAAVPVILGQPKAVRVQLNATEEAVFTVKVAPAPQGEKLSYQWYKNTVQSNEGGEAISGATEARYAPDKSVETDDYVYCMVTNTNDSNGKAETVSSQAVKRLIRTGSLAVDAEQPKVVQQPVGKVIPISTNGAVTLTVEAVSLDKGELSYQWYKNAADNTTSGVAIDGATAAAYTYTINTAAATTEYYYCKITNTNETVDGAKTASLFTRTARVEVEESYPVYFSTEGNGSIIAIYKEKIIETGSYVKKGEMVRFFAQADNGYEVLNWNGNLTEIAQNKLSASIKVSQQETVQIVIRTIPNTRKLTIMAKKLKNVDIKWNNSYPYAFFVYDFRARVFDGDSHAADFQSLWSMFNGRQATEYLTQVKNLKMLYAGESVITDEDDTANKVLVKTFTDPPTQSSFELDTRLVKYNENGVNAAIYERFLSDYGTSRIKWIYHPESDSWSCMPSEISGNFSARSLNRNMKDPITVTYPTDFTLKRGENKNFTISYYIDNASYKAVGTVEVTYTLKWE